VEVCPGFELIASENAAALGHDSLEISKRREAQMVGHMRHVRRSDSWRFSLSASPIPENPPPAPSAGVRITPVRARENTKAAQTGADKTDKTRPEVVLSGLSVLREGFSPDSRSGAALDHANLAAPV